MKIKTTVSYCSNQLGFTLLKLIEINFKRGLIILVLQLRLCIEILLKFIFRASPYQNLTRRFNLQDYPGASIPSW